MTFQIRVETDNSRYTVIVSDHGQILRTDLSHFSGLQGRTIFSPAVDVPLDWFDCNTSAADLYFTTDEFILENFQGGDVTIVEVEWHLPFKRIIPSKGMIGNRKVVTPDKIVKYLQDIK